VPMNGDQAPTLTVVAKEAEAIRDGINWLLAGESLGSIARDWNRRGLRTRTGNLWPRGAVGRVLASARIAGLREHDGVLHPASWDTIVERDVWEAAREILSDPQRRFGRHPRVRVHELAGFIFCGRCGKPMIGYTNERAKRRYRCHPMLGCNRMGRLAEPVEELTRNTMFEWLDSGAYDAAVANAASDPSRMRELSDRVQALKKILEQLQDKQILAQLANDGIQVQDTKRLRAETERELDEAVDKLREAQGESGLIDSDTLRGLRANWDNGDLDEHRRL
jgi:site-specific DNA recombinase